MFDRPLRIGKMEIKNRLILAPLAGVSDVPFRRICQELGAGLTYVEMLSATAITHKSKKTYEMMVRHASEPVLGIQLSGPKPDEVAKAISILDGMGFDTIDINMGCPVRKIVSAGWGSAFLKDPERISTTVQAARAATAKPLSVKFRLGFTPQTINVEDTASRVTQAGADMLTIHGRTREDNYSTRVDCDGIEKGFQKARGVNPNIVVVGNGDVMNLESGKAMGEKTTCDAVMVSRGALGNPWIFRELLQQEKFVEPTAEEWLDVVLRHLAYHQEFYGDHAESARKTRKHLIWYATGFPRSNRLREQIGTVQSLENARALVTEFASIFPKDLRRFEETRLEHDPKYQMDRSLDRGVGDDGLMMATG